MSKPIACLPTTKESTGMWGCRAPEVPMRMMFNDFLFALLVLVAKSILANASNSFITISMLSGPIPVETTDKRFPLIYPV